MFLWHIGGGKMSQKYTVIIDKDTEEFLSMISELKKNNKEKYIETKGLIKGILLSEMKGNALN